MYGPVCNFSLSIYRKSPNTIHMIMQRDLANPQHLLGHSASSRMQQHPISHGSRSRSYFSISTGDQVEDMSSEQLQPERHHRHSIHSTQYGSQSQLMPEYHDNPYLATQNVLPVKRPPPVLYGTLPRKGRWMEMGGLSQPAAVYNPDHGASAAFATGGVPMMGHDYGPTPLYPNMGPMSQGPGGVYSASSRKRGKKKTRSVSTDSGEQQVSFDPKLAGALSQPDFTIPGLMSQPIAPPTNVFYGGRGGGSMRHAPPPRHGGRMYGSMVERANSLTQYDQMNELDEMGGPLARTASMAPLGVGPGNDYLSSCYGNKSRPPTVTLEETDSTEKRGGVGGAEESQGEELSIEWEVRECMNSVLQYNSNDCILEFNFYRAKETEGELNSKSGTLGLGLAQSFIVECISLQAIHNLVTAEQALCKELEAGIEAYVLPLKTILTSDTHNKIFLGVSEVIN